ncbi:helix-turn-helix domain-containing protein [Micromonospora chalcea]|uniref:helix-turn-helix domain-containing protein n=1 Tax=Micromonospora chalcea TaxID=1874 RepID=UPI0021A690EA|nr:helix-turn-helix transcriptional regulator [Micromonospora chalcea]
MAGALAVANGGGAELTPVALADARRALGRTLAARRRAVGVTQVSLARLVPWSRSTIANVEVGRQNVPRAFWENCDTVLSAHGQLLNVFDGVDWLTRRYHEQVAAEQSEPCLPPQPAQRCPCGGAWVLVPLGAGWPG